LARRYAGTAVEHRACADVHLHHGKRDLAEDALHRAHLADLWEQKLLAEIDAMIAADQPPGDPVELAAECRRLKLEVANLRLAVESNRRISIAIGMLMCRYRLTNHQAFAALRRASQNAHRKLNDVAESVIYLGDLPPDTVNGPTRDDMERRGD
jgi:hypothetical protein